MRILVVNEASFLHTGYSIYGKNILDRLNRDGYEVAELAVYTTDTEEKIHNIPWTVFSNLPTTPEEQSRFNSDHSNVYGKFRFEEVICNFQPHIVIDIRDPFMYDFEYYSPLRDRYHWMIIAPVDGVPQQPQWLDIFQDADSVFTYTYWAKEYLESYGLDIVDSASPAASEKYFPIDTANINAIKKSFNLSNNKIVGSIMRNQPRKLFEILIKSFSMIKDKDALLYLHTAIPDVGFDLIKILNEYNVLSRTLFTYICKNCNKAMPMFLSDVSTYCPSCNTKQLKMVDVYSSLPEENMNKIINIFDVYVQCASREGFGMPQAEAAACGIPIITVPYAGMNDIIKYISSSDSMKIAEFKLNNSMHMYEACPSSEDLCIKINNALESNKKQLTSVKNREDFLNHYSSWESVYQIWKKRIDSVDLEKIDHNKKYEINHDFIINKNQPMLDFTRSLIKTFVGERMIGSFLHNRLINDLHHGMTMDNVNNYYTKHFDGNNSSNFNQDIAIQIFSNMAKRNLEWRIKYNESISN